MMQQAAINHATDLFHKIETIEEQILDIKLSVLKSFTPSKKNLISLKGILKGVEISESDIEEAKKSLYSKIKI